MVLSRPGGDNDPPSLVSEVLSDAAIVPAMVIEINQDLPRPQPHHLNCAGNYKKHSRLSSEEERDKILEIENKLKK